jgi:hypothetical protein
MTPAGSNSLSQNGKNRLLRATIVTVARMDGSVQMGFVSAGESIRSYCVLMVGVR